MTRSTRCAAPTAAALALPATALAHGGISSLGALLPFFIAMWTLGLLMTIWFFYSIGMFMLSVTSITPRKQKIFKVFSYSIAGIYILLALISMLFFAWVLFLGSVFMAVFLIFVTNLILARNERRMTTP